MALRHYDTLLQQYPIVTKASTSCVIFGIGDALAQKLEHRQANHRLNPHDKKARKNQSLDMKRILRMAMWGMLFAPIGHLWYGKLEHLLPSKTWSTVASKIALDQLMFTPPTTLLFFSSTHLFERAQFGDLNSDVHHFHTAFQHAQDKLIPTLRVNYCVWPVIHIVTFTSIPLNYRIFFINIMSLGWSSYLSMIANKKSS